MINKSWKITFKKIIEMKIIKTALIIFEFLLLLSCTNDKIIGLPLTVKKGYGPFETGLRGLPTYRKDPKREMTCLENPALLKTGQM